MYNFYFIFLFFILLGMMKVEKHLKKPLFSLHKKKLRNRVLKRRTILEESILYCILLFSFNKPFSSYQCYSNYHTENFKSISITWTTKLNYNVSFIKELVSDKLWNISCLHFVSYQLMMTKLTVSALKLNFQSWAFSGLICFLIC